MSQHANRLQVIFQRSLVRNGVDAERQATNNQYLFRREISDQFFSELFTIWGVSPRADDGNYSGCIERSVPFIK
jgi:hypothetical protein